MRLLFDQNLSYKLVDALLDLFPDSTHVKMLDLDMADDRKIWDFAKNEGYVIVSKDADFHQFSFLYGAPPKVIWINIGNCTTKEIEITIRQHKSDIDEFANSLEAAFLEIE